MRLPLLAFVWLLICATASARADITYFYTGMPFDHVSGSYTTDEHVSGYFTLDGPLLPNVTLDEYYGASPVSFSFTDGVETIDQTNANFFEFGPFTTDSSGNITGYETYVLSKTGGIGAGNVYVPTDKNGVSTYSAGVSLSGYGESHVEGLLTEGAPASITPEPSTFALLSTGLLGVASVIKRRFA